MTAAFISWNCPKLGSYPHPSGSFPVLLGQGDVTTPKVPPSLKHFVIMGKTEVTMWGSVVTSLKNSSDCGKGKY